MCHAMRRQVFEGIRTTRRSIPGTKRSYDAVWIVTRKIVHVLRAWKGDMLYNRRFEAAESHQQHFRALVDAGSTLRSCRAIAMAVHDLALSLIIVYAIQSPPSGPSNTSS